MRLGSDKGDASVKRFGATNLDNDFYIVYAIMNDYIQIITIFSLFFLILGILRNVLL